MDLSKMNLENKLEELVLRHLPGDQYFITEIVAKPAGAKTKISIFLDGDQGIDIDTCALVSRKVGNEIEELELMKHPYTLMISSPGLDRPLKLTRQYHRNLGKALKIRLEDQKSIEGLLSEVTDQFIVIEKQPDREGKSKEKIPFGKIETAHVLVTF